jgi:hypothetical protein
MPTAHVHERGPFAYVHPRWQLVPIGFVAVPVAPLHGFVLRWMLASTGYQVHSDPSFIHRRIVDFVHLQADGKRILFAPARGLGKSR